MIKRDSITKATVRTRLFSSCLNVLSLLIGGAAVFAMSIHNPLASKASVNDTLPDLLPRDEEITLALSAAPEHLQAGAAVYVWERGGYVKAREGTNGFTCMVLKVGNVLGPICYDAEGTRTTLHRELLRAKLIEQGLNADEVGSRIKAAYDDGTLKAPAKHGVAYMLSENFERRDPVSGEVKQMFPPHIMFYAPYLTNADLGFKDGQIGNKEYPWLLREGEPNAYIIVVPKLVKGGTN